MDPRTLSDHNESHRQRNGQSRVMMKEENVWALYASADTFMCYTSP